MLSTLIRGYYKIKQLYSSFCTCETTPINHSVSLRRVSCKEFVSEFSTRKNSFLSDISQFFLSANYIQFLPSFPLYTGFWEAQSQLLFNSRDPKLVVQYRHLGEKTDIWKSDGLLSESESGPTLRAVLHLPLLQLSFLVP